MVFRRVLLAAALAVSAAVAMKPASAQTSPPPQLPQAWQFAITPRIQWLFLNFNASISSSRFESASFPFYGGTLEVTPPGWRSMSFIFTGLDGNDYNLEFTDKATGAHLGTAEFHRLDLEALLRYRLEGTGVSLFGGFRFIRQRVKTTLDVPNFIFFNTGTPLFDNRIHFYLAELGGGYAYAIDPRGEHSLFINGIVGIGASRAVDNSIGGKPFHLFAVTLDVNAGYNWQFSSCCAVQARYRAFSFPAGNRTLKDIAWAHGPELGLTFRF